MACLARSSEALGDDGVADEIAGHAGRLHVGRLEGQEGSDQLYGGGGIDVLLLDVDAAYLVRSGETFNGHFGNLTQGDEKPESLR